MAKYKIQILVIIVCLTLLGILYLLPNKPNYVADTIPAVNAGMASYEAYVNSSKSRLESQQKDILVIVENLENQLNGSGDIDQKIQLTDSLSKLCLFSSPLLSAHYSYQKALFSQDSKDWVKAGDMYLLAIQSESEEAKEVVMGKAIYSFEQAVKIDSSNIDAQVRLAVAYIEDGKNPPMKGISMLRKLADEHPSTIAVQFNLGLLSIKSGQYDKAIYRFTKVLELDSSYYQAHFYLGQCELQLGNKQKAIEKFKYYQYLCTDSIEKNDIEQYINQLITT